MKLTRPSGIMLTAFVVLAAQASQTWALTCDAASVKYWDGQAGTNNWEDDVNWGPDDQKPGVCGRAQIGAGYTVNLNSSVNIDTIELTASTATLVIKNGAVLSLNNNNSHHSDSYIVGEVKIEKGGVFEVSANQAMQGNGGRITGLTTGGTAVPVIRGASAGNTLTTYGVNNASRSTSLVVQGNLDLQAALVNDAYVVANNTTLTLSTNAKSGSGYWVAESGANTLKVDQTVTGAGTWQLPNDATAKIWFNVACVGLTGNFEVKKGTLDVDQNLCTTGELTFESVNVGDHPRIDVASTKHAYFSMDYCS